MSRCFPKTTVFRDPKTAVSVLASRPGPRSEPKTLDRLVFSRVGPIINCKCNATPTAMWYGIAIMGKIEEEFVVVQKIPLDNLLPHAKGSKN